MKIISWNVNGIRSLNCPVKDTLNELTGDIICFQEVKASRCNIEEENVIIDGFNSYFIFPKYTSGYSGVATFCSDIYRPYAAEEGLSSETLRPDEITAFKCDLSEFTNEIISSLESEGRAVMTGHNVTIGGSCKTLVVINVYCPRVDPDKPERAIYQANFLKLLQNRAEILVKNNCHVIIVGDMNVSHRPIDHCDPCDIEEFESRPSRQWLSSFLQSENNPTGFVDTFRHLHPELKEAYTCWNTLTGSRKTNYGTRIDYVIVDHLLTPYLEDSFILSEIEGSDHCPVGITLKDCLPMAALKCPSICTKYWPEFAGKQTKIASFMTKLKPPEVKKANRIVKRVPKQQSITGFFSSVTKPKLPEMSSPELNSPQTELETNEPNLQRSELNSVQVTVWKNLLKGPPKYPKCKGHEETCVLRTVKKQGDNLGRDFFVCNRPVGASGNLEARCDYFKWK